MVVVHGSRLREKEPHTQKYQHPGMLDDLSRVDIGDEQTNDNVRGGACTWECSLPVCFTTPFRGYFVTMISSSWRILVKRSFSNQPACLMNQPSLFLWCVRMFLPTLIMMNCACVCVHCCLSPPLRGCGV